MKNLIVISFFVASPWAHAWDEHQKIMNILVESPDAKARAYLDQAVKIPCTTEEKNTIAELSVELELNEPKVPLFSKIAGSEDCTKSVKMKLRDLIASQFIDEPDFGMDQDLPDSADPNGDRAWMGGKTGPTSQGFRHMYFPGIKWSSPLKTFQFPTHAIGQAPERFKKIHAVSERFFKQGNLFWGLRTLIWSLHFVQDLHQPFHAIQIPSLKMVPFSTLFKSFVARTTQAVANYHFAFEGLILEYMNEGEAAGLSECLILKTAPSTVSDVFEIIRYSGTKGKDLGKDLVELFPKKLKSKDIDLTRRENPDTLDYYALINAQEEQPGLKATFDMSCELMHHLSALTWGELDQAFKLF